jgi:hypothetical protein
MGLPRPLQPIPRLAPVNLSDIEVFRSKKIDSFNWEAVVSRLPREITMSEQLKAVCDTEQMDANVTAVIVVCPGDPRTVIKALLVENLIQEGRI